MNANDIISSKILSNVDIVADIYKIIKEAATKTIADKEVRSAYKNTCIIKPNQPGKTRVTARCTDSSEYSIGYNADDLTIVGGSVLTIYDSLLAPLKTRKGLTNIESYIKKRTSDIDIVWWPRPSTNKEIITSRSYAILVMVDKFVKELTENFRVNKDALFEKVKEYVEDNASTNTLDIYVTQKPFPPAGVITVNIIFNLKGKALRMCDILVHDSGASQRFDMKGNEITTLEFMTEDPVYCVDVREDPKHINYVSINGVKIGVTNIRQFIIQQIFAFNNLIRESGDVKGFINMKRLLYLTKILSSSTTNQNISNIREVFAESPEELQRFINILTSTSILNYSKTIDDLCKSVNKDTDALQNEICLKADDILKKLEKPAEIELYKKHRLEEYEILYNRARTGYKSAPTSQLRRQYDDLQRSIHSAKVTFSNLSVKDLILDKLDRDQFPETFKNDLNTLDDQTVPLVAKQSIDKILQDKLSELNDLKNTISEVYKRASDASIKTEYNSLYVAIEEYIYSVKSVKDAFNVSDINNHIVLFKEEIEKIKKKEASIKVENTILSDKEYKSQAVSSVQKLINRVKDLLTKDARISLELKRLLVNERNRLVEYIQAVKASSPRDVISRKQRIENEIIRSAHYVDELESLLDNYIRALQPEVAAPRQTVQIAPGYVDPYTRHIWSGRVWVPPGGVDPESRYLWNGVKWQPPLPTSPRPSYDSYGGTRKRKARYLHTRKGK